MNHLGVTVCYQSKTKRPPFIETRYFYQLATEAKKHAIHLTVFSPIEINWQNRTVPAWVIEKSNRWEKRICPLPSLIYDRCYYVNSQHYLKYKPYVQRLMNDPNIRFLGRPLSGKYQTHLILKKCKPLQPFLPETICYHSIEDVTTMLQKYQSVCLKPNGGSHGRGVIKLTPYKENFFVEGRTLHNQPFRTLIKSHKQLAQWITKFIQRTRYIIQPYLQLSTAADLPFDLRILVQKDGNLAWKTTGLAVRVGKAHSLTSNLHGGGTAVPYLPFIKEHFSANTHEQIHKNIQTIISIVPSFIEQNYGPLVELGLDVGIDRNSHVWLLEVNSKPGRSVFLRTGNKEIHHLATSLPILYSKALLQGSRRQESL